MCETELDTFQDVGTFWILILISDPYEAPIEPQLHLHIGCVTSRVPDLSLVARCAFLQSCTIGSQTPSLLTVNVHVCTLHT